jgi:hypothetical protein
MMPPDLSLGATISIGDMTIRDIVRVQMQKYRPNPDARGRESPGMHRVKNPGGGAVGS